MPPTSLASTLFLFALCATSFAARPVAPLLSDDVTDGNMTNVNTSQCITSLLMFATSQGDFAGDTSRLMQASFGRGVGDLGCYETCRHVGLVARYAWIDLVGQGVLTSVGVCVPRTCSESNLNASLTFIFQSFFPNQSVPALPKAAAIHFADEPDLGTSGYLTVIALVLLGIPVVLATLAHIVHLRYNHLFSNQREEEGKERYQMMDDPVGDGDYRAVRFAQDVYRPQKSEPACWVSAFSLLESVRLLFADEREDLLTPGAAPPAGTMTPAMSMHMTLGMQSSMLPGSPINASNAASPGGQLHPSHHASLSHAQPRPTPQVNVNAGPGNHRRSAVTPSDSFATDGGGGEDTALTELACLNGLRVLALLWVILGHSVENLNHRIKNEVFVKQFVSRRFSFQLITSAGLGADALLFLSGFLAAYILYLVLERQQVLYVHAVYLHRLLRFWPALLICLFLWWFVSVAVANGPLWYQYTTMVSSQCSNYWWADLLFVNNLLGYNPDSPTSCMPWTWFLSLDMQLFLLAPLVTWLYFRWPRVGACVITLGIIACLCVNAVLSYVHDLSPNVIWGGDRYKDYISYVFVKPWTRAAPYLVGMATCFVYRASKSAAIARQRARTRTQSQQQAAAAGLDSPVEAKTVGDKQSPKAGAFNRNRLLFPRSDSGTEHLTQSGNARDRAGTLNLNPDWDLDWQVESLTLEIPFSLLQFAGYVTGIVLLGATIFGPIMDYANQAGFSQQYDTDGNPLAIPPVWNSTQNLFYITFARFAFAVGVGILLLLTLLSPNGLINQFLSAKFFLVLSRLCFIVYLVHPMVIWVVYSSHGSLIYFQDVTIVYFFVTNTILSFALALAIHLLVERPARNLERFFWDKVLSD